MAAWSETMKNVEGSVGIGTTMNSRPRSLSNPFESLKDRNNLPSPLLSEAGITHSEAVRKLLPWPIPPDSPVGKFGNSSQSEPAWV